MKKFILLVVFIFCSLAGVSQNQYEQEMQQEIAITEWTQVGQAQNCNASFYWLITQSQTQDQYGRFLFKVYFYSNSRYCDGSWAQTYLQGVYFIVNGQLINQNPGWVIFREVYQPRWLSVWAPRGSNIQFKWASITVN